MLRQVVLLGNPILRKKASSITLFDAALEALAADMIETMDASNGIGLAAPQIGYSLSLFVLRNYVEVSEGKFELSEPMVYVNPTILARSDEVIPDEEGCLSLPGIRVEVYRPTWIEIEAQDLKGNFFKAHIEGFNARVRLHEFDHLQGVMIIDYLSKKDKKKFKDKIEALEKKGQEAL